MEPSAVSSAVAEERPWRPGLVLGLILSYFLLFGVIIGTQGALWADLVLSLRLSSGVFGTVQLVGPLVSVVVLLQGGQLVAWAGKKRLAVMGLLLLGAALVALAQSTSIWALAGVFALFGLGNALLETVINSATLDWEISTGRDVMNLMHAGFSGGAVLGAILGGSLLGLGWSYSQVLLLLAVACGLVLLATLPVRYPPAEAAPPGSRDPLSTLRVLTGQSVLVALAFISLLGIVGESVGNTWSVIYLRQLGVEAFLGGAAFALFNASMLIGRLCNAAVVARLGVRSSLIASGIGLGIGGMLLLLPGAPIAVLAFVVMGLTTGGVVPTVLSAAARYAPGNSGAVTGGIMSVSYACFMICPPLIGWLAELFSLQIALLSVVAAGGLLLLLARRLPRG